MYDLPLLSFVLLSLPIGTSIHMKLNKLVALVVLLFALSQPIFAQQVIEEVRYNNGKVLLGQKKYTLAMAELLPLTNATPTNPYAAQASYFYALAALEAKKLQEAYKMLQQLKQQHAQWTNMPEAQYLLANVLFERQEYDKALSELSQFQSATLRNDTENLKRFYLTNITDKGQLEALVNSHPNDRTVAQIYADKLISGWYKPEDKSTLERLVSRHNLDRERYLSSMKKRKQGYNIAALLPFQLNQDLSQNAKKNYFVDLYAGMQLAQEMLQEEGVQVNLYAYDAGTDTSAVKRLLNSPDIKQMDLVIGPVYRSTAKVAARFARENSLPVINPLSQDLEMAENNPNVYLFESSVATQARQAATYAFNTFSPKTAIIVYESAKDDTTFAFHYRQQFIKLGGKVRTYKKINSNQAQPTANAFRSLNLSELGHLAIFSDKMTAAVNAISLLQGKAAQLPVVTYEKWLEINQISLSQLDALEVYFISPKYIAKDSPAFKNFKIQYLSKYNLPPSIYAFAGFEMLNFYGRLLQQHGPNLDQALREARIKPGVLYNGVGYTNGANRNELKSDNQYVPITKLENLQLMVVNPVYN